MIGGGNTSLVRADATYTDKGHTFRYIPPSYYPLPDEMRATMCFVIGRAVDDPSEVSRIIIPCGELLRFYFGTSTTLLKEIVMGGLDIGSNTIYNPELTGWGPDGTAQVQLRKRIDDDDAPVAARIGLSCYAQQVVRHIHASIERNSANGIGYIPEVLPPFVGQTTMRLHGKLVKSGPNWHLLVFWIESCSAPFPFERLRWARDNDGRKAAPHDPDLPEAWPKETRSVKHPPASGAEAPEIRSDDEPSLDRERTEIKLTSPRFTDLLGKDIQKEEKLEQYYRAARPPRFGTRGEIEGFGTADGQYRDTPLDRLEISHDLQGNEPPAHRPRAPRTRLPRFLSSFLEALEILKNTPGVTCCRVIPVPPDELTRLNKDISFFPQRIGKRVLKWSYIEYPEKRRQVVVAEVCFHDYWFYFLESERRPDVEGSRRERYVTLVVHQPLGLRFRGHELLERILLRCAQNDGVWLRKWPWTNLLHERFTHQPGTVERFAGGFVDYMRKFIPESGDDPTREVLPQPPMPSPASGNAPERREASA
jgi:hypothetical protein